jgi:hypothetical protein
MQVRVLGEHVQGSRIRGFLGQKWWHPVVQTFVLRRWVPFFLVLLATQHGSEVKASKCVTV